MSSNDSQLYNMDEGGVLSRLGSASSGLQRRMEGELDAKARINQEASAVASEKEARAEGGAGIGVGVTGIFSGGVNLVKSRVMKIAKQKAQNSLDDLIERSKASKQSIQDRLNDGGDGDAPPTTFENQTVTGGDAPSIQDPQTAPARSGDITQTDAPDIPARTITTEATPAEYGTQSVPAPARLAGDEIFPDGMTDEEVQASAVRVQARFNNLDGNAQQRSDDAYNSNPDRVEDPQTLADRKTNVEIREETVGDEETNPATTFKDPNLSVQPEHDALRYSGNDEDILAKPDTVRNPASFDNPPELNVIKPAQPATTETIPSRAGGQQPDQAPDIPARTQADIAQPDAPPSAVQAQLSGDTQDALASLKGSLKTQMNLSDEDAGNLVTKLASGGSDLEDIIGAGTDILSSLGSAGSGVLGFLGAGAEVLGPLSAIAGVGLGIYGAIESGQHQEEQEAKVSEYQSDLQKLSSSTELQTGSIAMPTMDTSQFRTGGMLNF